MNSRLRNIVIVIFLCTAISASQEHLYTINFNSSYITSSKLFYSPNNSNDFLRSQYHALDNIFGVGVELRRTFEESIVQVGIGVEFISTRESFSNPISSTKAEHGYDGFSVFPIEFTGYAAVPFNSETVHMYIGGGAGLYIGRRNYEYEGVVSQTISQKAGYGIHIVSGIEYMLSQKIALLSEVKFRDIQFETTNVFSYKAGFAPPYLAPFSSRFSIDGMTLKLGLAARL